MNSPKELFVGTRGSPLALKQTEQFVQALCQCNPGLNVHTLIITTSGDRIQDRFLSSVGGKGLFVKEIEEDLLCEEIDFAVHSLKDLPAVLPKGLEVVCYPQRRSPWDVLITPSGQGLDDLTDQATIGTTSLRRRSQLRVLRGDLKFTMLRGNIDTRLRKLSEGDFDAIILAQAGMERLGLDQKNAVELPIIPAPGQGTLAIEARRGDDPTLECLRKLHHPDTALEASLERKVMRELGGDCNLPLGVLARVQDQQLSLTAFVGMEDGSQWIQLKKDGVREESDAMVKNLLADMVEQGAEKIMEACQEPHDTQ